MLRSAAKNHARVTVVCDPKDYPAVLAEIAQNGEVSRPTRERLAGKAFAHTSAYDAAISGWLTGRGEADGFPRHLTVPLEKAYGLRYGENPHQAGAFYRERHAEAGSLSMIDSVGSGAKELSFNNLVDLEAALDAVREFENPAAVVVKHTSPCGVATGPTLADAYRAARDADAMSLAQIEAAIAALGQKARDGSLALDDLQGGTFTISNGGVYGSLMSTPILNAPQSGILGMHKIQERPMAIGGQVVIRPMMYLALSYDHRVVDGQGAVTFLVHVKEAIEEPQRLLLDL